MNLQSEIYLLMSQLVYLDLPTSPSNQTLEDLNTVIAGQLSDDDSSNPIYTNLLGLYDQDWTLLNFQSNTTAGFAGLVAQNTEGQLVFSFRGTELENEELITVLQDIVTDTQIALPGQPLGEPNQFIDAYNFVKTTVESIVGHTLTSSELKAYIQQNEVTFTGHSLGGGLAQYMTVLTDGESTTFNAVGIGQTLEPQMAIDYAYFATKITDYVNTDDIVGNYGTQIGTTVYLAGNLSNEGVEIDQIAQIFRILAAVSQGQIDSISAGSAIERIVDSMDAATKNYLNHQMSFDAHSMEHMLVSNGSGGYALNPSHPALNDVQPIITSISQLASSLLPGGDILNVAAAAAIVEGIDNIESGVTQLGSSTSTFITNTSDLASQNIQDAQTQISQIIDTKIAELRQTIPALNNDVTAIKNEILAVYTEIVTELNALILAAKCLPYPRHSARY